MTLKKAGLVGTSAVLGGAVASIASSSVVPVILGSAGSAFVTSAVVETMSPKAESIIMENCENAVIEAPDTIWTVAEQFVSIAGIGGILAFVVVPFLLGFLTPGPTKLNRKTKTQA